MEQVSIRSRVVCEISKLLQWYKPRQLRLAGAFQLQWAIVVVTARDLCSYNMQTVASLQSWPSYSDRDSA